MVTTERQLRNFASTRLADVKVPLCIHLVDALSVNDPGTVGRRVLSEQYGRPDAPRDAREPAAYRAPHNGTERTLAASWEKLGVARVGDDDDLVALGADSLAFAQAANLYTLQFFDRPALARRGGQVFASRCASCHGVGTDGPGPGKPVPEWDRLEDPISLIYQMWNHASSMKQEFAGNRAWVNLDGPDLLDLTAYLQSVQRVPRNSHIALPVPAEGRSLTVEHCGACHGGSDTLARLMQNKTLMDIGAVTWNHVPLMEAVPVLSSDDFRKIVAYVWELQYRGPAGVASRGERVFQVKGCIACHRSPVSPQTPLNPRPGKTFTPLSMVALSWSSGREMHRQIREKGMPWPRLSPDDVSNLVAYLNRLGR